jgi:hypothetical protein
MACQSLKKAEYLVRQVLCLGDTKKGRPEDFDISN